MISTIAIASLIALAATGIVIILAIGLSSGFRMEAIHWLAAVLCVAVSTFFISLAVGASKALKAVNQTAETAKALVGGANDVIQGTANSTSSLLSLIPEEYRDQVSSALDEYMAEANEQGYDVQVSGISVQPLANSYIETIRLPLERKLKKATIWSVVVTVVLNLVLLLLLLNAGSKSSNKMRSYSSDDDFLGGDDDLDTLSSSLDDDLI